MSILTKIYRIGEIEYKSQEKLTNIKRTLKKPALQSLDFPFLLAEIAHKHHKSILLFGEPRNTLKQQTTK